MQLLNSVKVLAGTSILALSGCSLFGNLLPISYNLPEGKVAGERLCGSRRCATESSDGMQFQFNKQPYSPPVRDASTPVVMAQDLLGQVTPDDFGGTPAPCAVDGPDPFEAPRSAKKLATASSPRSAEYSRTVVLNIKVDAAVDADMLQISQVAKNLASSKLEELKTSLRSAYESANSSTLVLKGKYQTFAIDPKIKVELANNPEFASCLEKLKDGRFKLIESLGLLFFEYEFIQGGSQEAIAAADAKLKANGVAFDVKASVTRKVTERLTAERSNIYQVLVWNRMTREDIEKKWGRKRHQ